MRNARVWMVLACLACMGETAFAQVDAGVPDAAAPLDTETEGVNADPMAKQGSSEVETFELPPIAIESAPAVDAPAFEPRYGTGSKLDVPLEEQAATVNVVDEETMRQRGAGDVNTALNYVAGVNPVWRYGGFQFVKARGFRTLMLVDGRRDDRAMIVNSAPQSGLWDLDRIEVLKGPSSVLYGYGAVGGAVNLVRKRPRSERAYVLDLALGTPNRRRAHVGATGPITDELLYRVDLGHTFRRDFRGHVTSRNQGTVTLDWQPHPDHRLTLRSSLYVDRYNTDAGIPTIERGNELVLPPNTNLSNRYNAPEDFLDYTRFDFSLSYQWRLSDHLELRERFAFTRDEYEYLSSEFLTYVDEPGMRPQVERGSFYFFRHWYPWFNQVELEADFELLVEHQAVAGYEISALYGFSERSSSICVGRQEQLERDGDGNCPGTVPAVDFVHPVEPRHEDVGVEVTRIDDPTQIVHSWYLHDHMSLPWNLTLALGGRLDLWSLDEARTHVDRDTGEMLREEFDEEGDGVRGRDTTAFTWRAGLIYRPFEWLIPYVSYATAFRPNTQMPEDGSQLEPERGRQVELGTRLRFDEPALQVDLAAYDIRKQNVAIGIGGGRFSQAGEARSRGVEVDARMRISTWLAVRAGYAYTDAELEELLENQGTEEMPDLLDLSGNRPRFVPDHSATLWGVFDVLDGVGIATGGRWFGKQFADRKNGLAMPSYVLWDAAAWYREEHFELMLTVTNILGEGNYFVSSIGGDQVTPGPQREALAQVRFKY